MIAITQKLVAAQLVWILWIGNVWYEGYWVKQMSCPTWRAKWITLEQLHCRAPRMASGDECVNLGFWCTDYWAVIFFFDEIAGTDSTDSKSIEKMKYERTHSQEYKYVPRGRERHLCKGTMTKKLGKNPGKQRNISNQICPSYGSTVVVLNS